MTLDLSRFNPFAFDQARILQNRKSGQIYSADFNSGEGKYISTTFDSNEPYDMSIKISPRVELRLTYIFHDSTVNGVQLTKLSNKGKIDKIHLSTLDWEKVLGLLKVFDSMDIGALAAGSLILDKSVVNDPDKLEEFLNTVAADPQGKEKFQEVADNFGFITAGGVKNLAEQKKNADKMQAMLDDLNVFQEEKAAMGVGKDEEVWQRFFEANDWLLGSDVVEILDERVIDEHNTVDLPTRSVDGFLDIIELKLPAAQFWTAENNPNADLTKAIMQCMRYITEADKRANDHEKVKALGCEIVKPRITLVYGRSKNWTPDQHKQLRILNSSFHNITVLTYDHVMQRANRLSGE